MHSNEERIVHVNMMTLDLHADLNGKLGDNLRLGLNAYLSIDFNGNIKKCIKSELKVNFKERLEWQLRREYKNK